MDNTKKPAFPTYPGAHNGLSGEEYGMIYGEPGLTKREYLAGLAMQGILANPKFMDILEAKLPPEKHCEFVSTVAIEQADDILKQLKS